MKRGIILSLVVFLLLVSFASAFDTVIKINTLSNHTLNINILNPDRSTPGSVIAFDIVNKDSGETGEVDYAFSNSAESFDLSIFLLKEGKTILHKTFEDIPSGKTVMLTFIPGIVEIDKDYQEKAPNELEEANISIENQTAEINETENQTNEIVVEEVKKVVGESAREINKTIEDKKGFLENSFKGLLRLFKLSGFSVSDEKDFLQRNIFYYVFGVFLLGLVLFFVSKPVRRKLKNSYSSKKKKIEEREESLEEAKNKLKEMQEKVDELSNQKQEKIKEVKQKLIEDEKELMRLRGDKDKKKDD